MTRSPTHPTRPTARLARALALSPALLLAISVAAGAQSGTPVALANRSAPNSPSDALEQFARLELTTEQRKSVDSLAAAARSAREAVLARRGASASGGAAAGPSVGRSLSEADRAELSRIGTETEAGLQRILTPAQRQKLSDARGAMRQQHAARAEAAAKEAHAKRPTTPPADLRSSSPATATAPASVPPSPPR